MIRPVFLFLLPLAALPSLSEPAVAGGLEPTWVSSHARWIAHVDVEAALASDLVAQAMEHGGHVNVEWDELEEVQRELGIDPREDVDSVTIYSAEDDPEQAVILIVTNSKIDGALDRLERHVSSRPAAVDGFTLRRWQEDGHGDSIHTYVARKQGSDERVLLVSPDEDAIVHGVRVLRGHAASLSRADLDVAPSPGAFVYFAAPDGMGALADEIEPASQVARLVKSLVFEAGEFGGSVFLGLTVETDDVAEARKFTQILQGASALLALISESEEDVRPLLPLLQGLQVRSDGPVVRIRFEHETAALLELAMEASGHHDEWGRRHEVEHHDEDRRDDGEPSRTEWH